MRSTPSSSLFAARISYRSKPLFGGGGEEREYVEYKFVEASNADEAIIKAGRSCSVGALKCGVSIEVVAVEWARASRSTAKYDGEPLTESHGATVAKLVWTHG